MLSVVIPAHDAADTLAAQLDALSAQTWDRPWEVVVVDNASTDATAVVVAAAASALPNLRLVRATDGRGPAYARNVGARAASGGHLAFCDADDVVGDAWVAAMGEALAQHPFVSGPVELARLNPDWLVASRGTIGTREFRTRFEGRFPFASSCNLGIARELLLEVGGFDESLTVGEDIDLSMRLHLAGVPVEFVADAVVHYRFRPTLRSTYDRAVAYGAARPVLAERWRARTGEQVPRARWRNWFWLVRHLPDLGDRAGRAGWLWVAGQRWGALGAVRTRRFYC